MDQITSQEENQIIDQDSDIIPQSPYKKRKLNDEQEFKIEYINNDFKLEKLLSFPLLHHKCQETIKFEDALVLKILINQNRIDLEQFCNEKQLKYRVDFGKQVNESFLIKIMKILNPSTIQFQNTDFLILNIGKDLVYTDSFGYEFSQNNKELKNLIKNNRKSILSQNMVYDLISSNENKELRLCIQTTNTEDACIQNLKELFQKFQSKQIRMKGFINLGISLNQSCSQRYLCQLLRSITSIYDDLSQLSYPGEIQLFISQNQEESTLTYFKEVVKFQSIDFNQVLKGGSWSYEYIHGSQQQQQFSLFSGQSSFGNIVIPFSQEYSEAIEKAFLQKQQKQLIIMETAKNQQITEIIFNRQYQLQQQQPQFQQQQQSLFLQQQKEQQEQQIIKTIQSNLFCEQAVSQNNQFQLMEDDPQEEIAEIDLINFTETFLSSKSQRPMTQDDTAQKNWQYFDFSNLEFVPFEQEINAMIHWCQKQNKIGFFQYKRNSFTYELLSKVMEINFEDKTMINLKTGEKFKMKRAENAKYDHLVFEAFPYLKQSFIKIEENKLESMINFHNSDKIDNQQDDQNKCPTLEIRGQKNSINLINDILEHFKSNTVTHCISVNKNIEENHLQYLKYIGMQNNLLVSEDKKLNELQISGYRKTINQIRPQILKILELKSECLIYPSDWVSQINNLEIYDCPLKDESLKEIINLIINQSSGKKIVKIERVQNINLWKNYQFEKEKLQKKGDATEKWLFHGTRFTKPSVIYQGNEEGFDFRVSKQGKYGRGTYFHDLPSFSLNYAYSENNTFQILCAKVLIGKCCPSQLDKNLIVPPFIPGTDSLRYDSVCSLNQIGNNEYVIFNNNRAYPYFLLTFAL